MNNKKLPQNNGVRKAYLSVQETATYIGISERTIRNWLSDPISPLPHYRVGITGRIIRINRHEIDNWLQNFKVAENGLRIDSIVDDLIEL